MAATLATVLAGLFTGASVVPVGAADAVLDANTFPVTSSTSGVAMSLGFPLAQTFRAAHDGPIDRVDLGVSRQGTAALGGLGVALTETTSTGLPGAPLAYGVIATTSLPSTPAGLASIVFDPAPVLVAGTQYALVLEPTSGCCVYLRYESPIGRYTGGRLLYRDRGVWVPWLIANTDALFGVWVAGAADENPPIVSTPSLLDEELSDPAGAVMTWTASAVDDVDGPVPVTCDPPSGSVFALGDTLVTCTATDAAGNAGTASFTVRVVDTRPPEVTLAPRPAYAVNEHIAVPCSATDDGSGVATYTCPGEADAWRLGAGVHEVRAEATDVAGNWAERTVTFEVLVDTAGLAGLTGQLVTNRGIANSLVAKLQSGQAKAFENQLAAQAGRSISVEDAALLLHLAASL